jgi:putative hemolysin
MILLVAGCSSQMEHAAGPSAQPVVNTTSPAVTIPQANPAPDPDAAAASRQCAEYGEKLQAAQQRLAKLRKEGPRPPAGGYDFSDDYAQDVAIAESEVDFYAGLLNDECSGEPQSAPPEEPTYDPDPSIEPEPDYGP